MKSTTKPNPWDIGKHAIAFQKATVDCSNYKAEEMTMEDILAVISTYPIKPIRVTSNEIAYELDEAEIDIFKSSAISYMHVWQCENDVNEDFLQHFQPSGDEEISEKFLLMMQMAYQRGFSYTIDFTRYYR